MEFTVEQIAQIIQGEVVGNGNATINRLDKIEDGNPDGISFLANPKYENYIYETKATAVIVNKSFEPQKEIKATLIKVKDAYVAFTILLDEYNKFIAVQQKTGKERPCYKGKNVTLGNNIYRGAFSYIGDNTSIGDGVKIYPNTTIGDNVIIGENTSIAAGVTIYNDTVIGKNCLIQAGAVIGSDGFGFAPLEDGTYKTIPQMGNVIIEDNVCVGANTTIDRATMGSTIVRAGVKLDNLVQIAHNAEAGKNTVMAAQSGLAGSAKTGEHCIIGAQVGVAGHIEIGNNISIAGQSGVIKAYKKEGTAIMGSPAIDVKQYLKAYSVYKDLPNLRAQINELEEKILNLSVEKDK